MTIARTRRRVTSTEVPAPLGQLLREMREKRGMSQVELAAAAGLQGSSSVSRLESGKSDSVSLDLLASLAEALADDGRLWAAAGALPIHAVRELAPLWRAVRPDALRERTGPAVQRVHQGESAEAILSGASVPVGRRVDVEKLAVALNPPYRVRRQSSEETSVSFNAGEIVVTLATARGEDGRLTSREGDLERYRFLVTHAIAHIQLGDEDCRWPAMVRGEVPAVDMACRLLAPQGLLEDAVRAVVTDDAALANPWRADSGRIVAEVARRLGVPAWVALRRLGEDGAYDTYAEDEA
jgi:transcriptional regulator with XRE-family HTH domain